jgi:hypothetical protein
LKTQNQQIQQFGLLLFDFGFEKPNHIRGQEDRAGTRRNRHLSAMNEITTAASTSASLDEILSTAGKRIREITGYPGRLG